MVPFVVPEINTSARGIDLPVKASFITPEIVESFCVLGEPGQHVEKLKLLRDAGVTQFNIYFENGDEERLIADYAKHIIPHFK